MNFPSSPTLNQTYTFEGKTWKWNGIGWQLVLADVIPIAGVTGLQAALDGLEQAHKVIFPTGTNDHTIINDATNGFEGVVVLAPGNWQIAGTVLMRPYSYIQGSGINSTILIPVGNITMFGFDSTAQSFTENKQSWGLKDCTLYGYNTNAVAINTKISAYSMQDVVIERVYFDGFGNGVGATTTPVVSINDPWGLRFFNNIIEQTGDRPAMTVTGNGASINGSMIAWNKIKNNGGPNLQIIGCDSLNIVGNEFYTNKALAVNLQIAGGKLNVISNNVFEYGYGYGIALTDATVGNVVSGNTGVGDGVNSQVGLSISSGCSNNVILGCVFTSYTTANIFDDNPAGTNRYVSSFNGATWVSSLYNVDYIDFDTTASYSSPLMGELKWNADEGTLDLGLNAGEVVLNIGEEVLYRVENQSGATILNGSLVAYTGTIGASGKILVAPWNPSTQAPFRILGLATEDIANGSTGYVTHFGKVRGIQTNGANYSETWAAGDIVYAGPTGGLTNVRPVAPNTKTSIGVVIAVHATNGTLFVRPRLSSSLNDDDLIEISSIANGDLLVYNSTNSRFQNTKVLEGLELTGRTYANGPLEHNVVGVGAGTTIDCSAGTYFTKSMSAAWTPTISNVPASRAFGFVIELAWTAGALTLPAGWAWAGGLAPTLSTGTWLLTWVTSDGGSNGVVVAQKRGV